ncbi:LysR substrate-binding domain-containing protein [Hydrogenophaga sp. BPS33]|uniref:LysR substrate-binding domain-containing protein n=1 Tax=Hydrogenophaga sp. BPS33 TaxID=2651974 RepID=UPI001320232C|nr:LysR substrate-binding domain-containing protein [Hydrogenophaga sp. BPS33]QHE85190.1 LysR family transcriptional regulator [Hydrogenophaga sp. BPS33]
MKPALPPLTALRAFEAAARHLSLKRAGEELHVTPAAISHQVIQLESTLGVQLFLRGHKKVTLTPPGALLARKLSEGFEGMQRAVNEVRGSHQSESLAIITTPAFAYQCLMPRLHEFIEDHPNVDVRVTTRIGQPAGMGWTHRGEILSVMGWAEECDVVICLGLGDYPGMNVDRVLPLSITPLCSPDFLQRHLRAGDPTSLRGAPLLHDERGSIYEGEAFWDMWLRTAGVSGVDTSAGQRVSHFTFALDAAAASRGIVATTVELAKSKIDSGQLVAPFGLCVPWGPSYHLATTPTSADRVGVQAFRSWLLGAMT